MYLRAKFVPLRRFRRAEFLLLVTMLIALPSGAAALPNDKHSDRPKLPYNMMGIGRDELDAYDSKAEPVAAATAALVAMNRTGWELIHKYFPRVSGVAADTETQAHPADSLDTRLQSNQFSEDAESSPIPLLSAVWSLPDTELSGRLKGLHDEVAGAMPLENYSQWKLEQLRDAVNGLTDWTRTAQGTRYRKPKNNLSFKQALQLYAMTLALIRVETKWADKADSPPPDMKDFTARLGHQLPQRLSDGQPASFFLYRPGVLTHPLNKEELEERADVVTLTRHGHTVELVQFPVYLTANQEEWNPAWIEPRDEQIDSTLPARKVEHDWTRLDGPYLWYRYDQLDGPVVYRATAQLLPDRIAIESERSIESRGAVKRSDRPADYNPALMTAFAADVDTTAAPYDALLVDPLSLDEQIRGLKSMRYFSNSFRAWCRYGLSASGLAGDGRTWISVLPDQPRPDGPIAQGSSPQ